MSTCDLYCSKLDIVTVESFKAWKVRFDKEMAVKKAREEVEKMKGMTPKEREEYKKLATRLTGSFGNLDTRLEMLISI